MKSGINIFFFLPIPERLGEPHSVGEAERIDLNANDRDFLPENLVGPQLDFRFRGRDPEQAQSPARIQQIHRLLDRARKAAAVDDEVESVALVLLRPGLELRRAEQLVPSICGETTKIGVDRQASGFNYFLCCFLTHSLH